MTQATATTQRGARLCALVMGATFILKLGQPLVVVVHSQTAGVSSLTLARVVDADPDVRRQAVRELSIIVNPQAVAALGGAALLDTDPRVREEAVRSLGEQGSEDHLPVYAQAVHDPSWRVRRAAIVAAGDGRRDRCRRPSGRAQ